MLKGKYQGTLSKRIDVKINLCKHGKGKQYLVEKLMKYNCNNCNLLWINGNKETCEHRI